MKNGPAKREYMRQWRLDHPDYMKAYNRRKYLKHGDRYRVYGRQNTLKRKYGITTAEYDAMLLAQDNKCALCENPPGRYRLAVDHDHTTGKVRKLLCAGCNTRMSAIEDPSFKAKAEAYLAKHQG